MEIKQSKRIVALGRGFKHVVSTVLIAGLLPLLFGCAYAEKERYMNFLADLDVINRFELCFNAAEERRTDFYTFDELEALKLDILSYENPNEEAARANGFLLTAAELLVFGTECVKINDTYNYELSLTHAKEYYAQANAVISAIIKGAENV